MAASGVLRWIGKNMPHVASMAMGRAVGPKPLDKLRLLESVEKVLNARAARDKDARAEAMQQTWQDFRMDLERDKFEATEADREARRTRQSEMDELQRALINARIGNYGAQEEKNRAQAAKARRSDKDKKSRSGNTAADFVKTFGASALKELSGQVMDAAGAGGFDPAMLEEAMRSKLADARGAPSDLSDWYSPSNAPVPVNPVAEIQGRYGVSAPPASPGGSPAPAAPMPTPAPAPQGPTKVLRDGTIVQQVGPNKWIEVGRAQ